MLPFIRRTLSSVPLEAQIRHALRYNYNVSFVNSRATSTKLCAVMFISRNQAGNQRAGFGRPAKPLRVASIALDASRIGCSSPPR